MEDTFHEEHPQDAHGSQESWACPLEGIPSSWAVPCSVVAHDEDDEVVLLELNASSDVEEEVFHRSWEMGLDDAEPNWVEEHPCGHSTEHPVAFPSKLHRQLAWHSRHHVDP